MTVISSRRARVDLARSAVVALLAVVQIVVSGLGGSGAIGEPIGVVANAYSTPLLAAGWTFAIWAPIYAGRSNYSELLAAGVHIYEWQKALMHAKTAVIDSEWASVGSTNLDWRSFDLNYEADLVVYDAAFARELETLFRQDVAASAEVKPEKWAQRGVLERAKEWAARRWERLL